VRVITMTRWRDIDASMETRTIFDYVRHESPRRRATRSGLNVIRAVTLAAAQELEHEHQPPLAQRGQVE
jgi:hypothetical protein